MNSPELLAISPLFRDLDPSALRKLSLETTPVQLGGGEILLREGDTATRCMSW